jgi:hypothetical protein
MAAQISYVPCIADWVSYYGKQCDSTTSKGIASRGDGCHRRPPLKIIKPNSYKIAVPISEGQSQVDGDIPIEIDKNSNIGENLEELDTDSDEEMRAVSNNENFVKRAKALKKLERMPNPKNGKVKLNNQWKAASKTANQYKKNGKTNGRKPRRDIFNQSNPYPY